MDLARKVLAGNKKSVPRLISMIEEGRDEGYAAVSFLFPYAGKAHAIGVTERAGALRAKSTGNQRRGIGELGEAIDPHFAYFRESPDSAGVDLYAAVKGVMETSFV